MLRRGFVAHAVTLAGGTAAGQGLVALSTPVLTRLYSPTDVGILAVYTSVLSILNVFAAMRYEMAIPLPEEESDGRNLVVLCFGIVAATTLATLAAVLLFGHYLVGFSRTPGLRPYLLLLPISILGSGAYQTLNYWAARRKAFGVLSATKATQSAGQVGIQIGGGLLHFGAGSLILGFIASNCLGIGSLLRRTGLSAADVSLARIAAVARAYRNFPLYNTLHGVTNVLGFQLPPLLFARYFGTESAGQFGVTMRVLGVPSFLVGQALAQVFYATVAEHRDEEQSRALTERVAAALFVVSFPLYSLVALHGPYLFSLVLGGRWETSGRYAQLMVPWFVFSFVASPLATFVLVKGKQRAAMFVSLYETGLRVMGIWIGIRYGSALLSVGLFAAAGTIIYVAYLGWVLRLVGTGLAHWAARMARFGASGVALVAVLWLQSRWLGPALPLASLLLSAASLGLFLAFSWRRVARSMA